MGVLLLKKWRKSAIFFVHFWCVTGVLVFFLSLYVGWGCVGGGRCVVVFGGFVFV